MSLRQRKPRLSDPAYLKWLRAQRCACGCLKGPPVDAAHVRSASYRHDKATGMAEKPDDKWALPLWHACHMSQHGTGELVWWRQRGVIDPFELCVEYRARYLQQRNNDL
jgi:hypothetical protein